MYSDDLSLAATGLPKANAASANSESEQLTQCRAVVDSRIPMLYVTPKLYHVYCHPGELCFTGAAIIY